MNTAKWTFLAANGTPGAAIGAGSPPPPTGIVTHQAIAYGSVSNVSATVVIEGTCDPSGQTGWTTIVTLNPSVVFSNPASGLNEAIDSAVASQNWPVQRARCTALTGTSVSVFTVAAV